MRFASSSKLTRFLLRLSGFRASCEVIDIVSEVSLPGGFEVGGLKVATGELVRIEDDGECFRADFAGDTDRGGGLCL